MKKLLFALLISITCSSFVLAADLMIDVASAGLSKPPVCEVSNRETCSAVAEVNGEFNLVALATTRSEQFARATYVSNVVRGKVGEKMHAEVTVALPAGSYVAFGSQPFVLAMIRAADASGAPTGPMLTSDRISINSDFTPGDKTIELDVARISTANYVVVVVVNAYAPPFSTTAGSLSITPYRVAAIGRGRSTSETPRLKRIEAKTSSID